MAEATIDLLPAADAANAAALTASPGISSSDTAGTVDSSAPADGSIAPAGDNGDLPRPGGGRSVSGTLGTRADFPAIAPNFGRRSPANQDKALCGTLIVTAGVAGLLGTGGFGATAFTRMAIILATLASLCTL